MMVHNPPIMAYDLFSSHSWLGENLLDRFLLARRLVKFMMPALRLNIPASLSASPDKLQP